MSNPWHFMAEHWLLIFWGFIILGFVLIGIWSGLNEILYRIERRRYRKSLT